MKPIASLSLDLDDKWSYMKTHGDPNWQSLPSYLDVVVPRVLDFLHKRDLSITFFLVGQDAALARNREVMQAIADSGHEVSNHSFHHEPWLHLYSEQQMEDELARAEEHIEGATGQKPRGFRGPGFSLSRTSLQLLKRRGYLYDATTLPNFLNPIARAYYFMMSDLSPEELQKRKALFGSFWDGLRPLRPYMWQTDVGELVEIPVTTMPLVKVPIHVSYILYLSLFSSKLALLYFSTAVRLCRLTHTPLSLLLHPLDFLGCEDRQDLSFFPAMRLPREKKLAVVSEVLRLVSTHFTTLTVQQHAQEAMREAHLRVVEPKFHQPA